MLRLQLVDDSVYGLFLFYLAFLLLFFAYIMPAAQTPIA